MTPAQSRAARGLLGWSKEALADRAAVSASVVGDFEDGLREVPSAQADALASALRRAGIAFGDGADQDVRLAATEGTTDEGLRPNALTTENDR